MTINLSVATKCCCFDTIGKEFGFVKKHACTLHSKKSMEGVVGDSNILTPSDLCHPRECGGRMVSVLPHQPSPTTWQPRIPGNRTHRTRAANTPSRSFKDGSSIGTGGSLLSKLLTKLLTKQPGHCETSRMFVCSSTPHCWGRA